MHVDEAEVIQVALLYEAGLGRQFDGGGLNYWVDEYETVPLDYISQSFLYSDEFSDRFGPAYEIETTLFIDAMYDNVLGRDPDAGGFDYWLDALESGRFDRDDVLVQFSLSNENYAQSPYVYDITEVSDGYWGF